MCVRQPRCTKPECISWSFVNFSPLKCRHSSAACKPTTHNSPSLRVCDDHNSVNAPPLSHCVLKEKRHSNVFATHRFTRIFESGDMAERSFISDINSLHCLVQERAWQYMISWRMLYGFIGIHGEASKTLRSLKTEEKMKPTSRRDAISCWIIQQTM